MMVRLETEKEREIRCMIDEFRLRRTNSCMNYLKAIISKTRDPESLKYLTQEILEDDSLKCLEPLIAKNKYTPAYIMAELALSNNPITRMYVALSLETPPKTILLLTLDENEFIRIAAEQNPRLPKKTFLEKLYIKFNNIINYVKCLFGFD